MANSVFLPFIIGIRFTDRILRNPRKIKGSFVYFLSKQNRNPKGDNFFKLTNYKRIFLKVRSNYSKILKNSQNFSVNIVTYIADERPVSKPCQPKIRWRVCP